MTGYSCLDYLMYMPACLPDPASAYTLLYYPMLLLLLLLLLLLCCMLFAFWFRDPSRYIILCPSPHQCHALYCLAASQLQASLSS